MSVLKFMSLWVVGTFLFGAMVMTGVVQIDKVLNQGTVTTEGKVISINKGLLTDCIEISKTTVGESAISSFCVWYEVELPKLKSTVEVIYTKSPYLFKDKITVKEI